MRTAGAILLTKIAGKQIGVTFMSNFVVDASALVAQAYTLTFTRWPRSGSSCRLPAAMGGLSLPGTAAECAGSSPSGCSQDTDKVGL